jgi:hypothetical protein
MANPSNAVAAALEAVRRTTAAQASAIDALSHAFDAEMVKNTGMPETAPSDDTS